eukprot:TRINITY_DN80895_c0_g1_i1.p1 TRINITY_DN80895_c0_g1~~TRINITY_DN80895_c0_g1_i1.p1  ORF type:complete len:2851 (+),score=920.78 TRINITY_DN80895_c0_g1_i1:84-8555(+)
MTSTDFHLRNVIRKALEQKTRTLVDDAFAIIEANSDRFSAGEFAPELLVLFAEVASDLREREAAVYRALQLYDRLRCEDDQFKARALLIRCVYEARQGTDTHQLKGLHSLQQLQYALGFLSKALEIATRKPFDERYGFLVYDVSLVFWDVARPMCRAGWQRHIVKELTDVVEALRVVRAASGAGGAADAKGKGGAGGAAQIPVAMDASWLVEFSLQLAFALEDAARDPEAVKRADEANLLVEELVKQKPNDPQSARLKSHVLSAKAYLARKAPGKMREDIDKAAGSSTLGAVLFVKNGGIPKEQAEEELIKAFTSIDKDYNLREAKEKYNHKTRPPHQAAPQLAPLVLLDLISVCRAACMSGSWAVAQPMYQRLEKFQIQAGRGRILMDLCKAEIQVYQACNIKETDPVSKMLLTPEQQSKREVDARTQAVKLCEQCMMAARRLDEPDLVEDAAVVMTRLGRELMCDEHRLRIHRSLHKCAELLEEIQSVRLAQLRVQVHFEVVRCEVAADLLTKGQAEMVRAKAIDYTAVDAELSDASKAYLADEDPISTRRDRDPASFVRYFEPIMEEDGRLLHWKTNLYEEATDVVDTVMLMLDQVQRQSSAKASLAVDLLQQGYVKLKAELEDVEGDRLEQRSTTFVPPPRHVTASGRMGLLPYQAPAQVSPDGPASAEITLAGAAAPVAIYDRRPRSEREAALERVKRIVTIMCKIGREAYKRGETKFVMDVLDRAVEAEKAVPFGPPPVEVDGALLIVEAAYTKALCLNKQLLEYGVTNGMDDTIEPEVDPEAAAQEADKLKAAASGHVGFDEETEFEDEELSAEDKAMCAEKKREMIKSLLYGLQKACEFKQWWMVANGLAHWWNLHLEYVELSHDDKGLLNRCLEEYRTGLQEIQKYLVGDSQLPNADLEHSLAARLLLAHIEVSVVQGDLAVLETEQLLLVKRLGAAERKLVMARVAELCKAAEKPLPELARLRPERLEAQGAADPKGKPAKGAKDAPPPVTDKTDLAGNEAEIMLSLTSVPYDLDPTNAKKNVDRAVELLSGWAPKEEDEGMLTLWVEMWTRLGRQCLCEKMNPDIGRKYALMCGIKGLGEVDAAKPKYASKERLQWRGACHALCGEVFRLLVDPQKQEKESLLKLRSMAVRQFERCCEYAWETKNPKLAIFGAQSLWNVGLPLLQSMQTRKLLIEPLQKATRALGAVKYKEDPFFFVGLYVALFDCHSDTDNWDAVHQMLNEAFPCMPSEGHRRLWSLRMLALSRQGKNVVVAMGKMKETRAKAEASIWMVLAHNSAKLLDQLDAYTNAIQLLQTHEQWEVVEVRMEFADWLLRNGFGLGIAREQLQTAADMLMDIEEMMEEESDEDDEFGDGEGSAFGRHSQSGRSARSGRSKASRGSRAMSSYSKKSASRRSVGQRSKGSRASARSRSSRASRKAGSRRARSSSAAGSVASKRSKQKKAEEDAEPMEQLYAHHYDALLRIYTTRSRFAEGSDFHSSLLVAAHFAVRFFQSTIELVNSAAQQLAALQPAPADAAEDASTAGRRMSSGRKASPTPAAASLALMPCFAVPERLCDWADEGNWPWCASSASKAVIAELLGKAVQNGIIAGDVATWAGHMEAITKPSVSFHSLNQLQQDLEELGCLLYAFPVVALLVQLSENFEEGPLRDAVACLAYMRLARYAAECRQLEAAQNATARWSALLPKVSENFDAFEEELERVRRERAGRPEPLDSDWLPLRPEQVNGSSLANPVSVPWSCGDLVAYEVWASLAEECALHGELFAASKLVQEGIAHANIYGNRRTLRKLQLCRARLAADEGRCAEAVKAAREIQQADLRQSVDAALLLAEVYKSTKQLVLVSTVLSDARKAVEKSPEAKTCQQASERSSTYVLATSLVRNAQALAELDRLAPVTNPTDDWLQQLNSVFDSVQETCSLLVETGLYRRCLVQCVDFMVAVEKVIEAKRDDLRKEPNLHTSHGGVLSYEILGGYTDRLVSIGLVAQGARDALMMLAMPSEGLDADFVCPAHVCCARLDVWQARMLALRRSISSSQEADRRRLKAGRGNKTVLASARKFFSPQEEGDRFGFAEKVVDPAECLETWKKEVDEQLDQGEKRRQAARVLSEIESSIALVSNAVTMLQPLAERPEGAAESPAKELPGVRTEALAELGRLHLELSASKWVLGKLQAPEPGAPHVWEDEGVDWRELAGMEFAERCSNVLQMKDPAGSFPAPSADDASPEEEGTAGDDDAIANASLKHHGDIGKKHLCDALAAAADGRQFSAARRALKALALEAYGRRCPEAAFEFLAWLQSVEACLKAQDTFGELLPQEHPEASQLRLLSKLEGSWSVPQVLTSYRTTASRLQRESPLFKRYELGALPGVQDLLLTYVPPLTLVVTMQVHEHWVYIGACATPADGPPADRAQQLRPFVMRSEMKEIELNACVKRLQAINAAIEKELIEKPQINETLQSEYEAIVDEVERALVVPVAEALEANFWRYTMNIGHPCNPAQLVLLPDSSLWPLPLERSPSLLRLFGGPKSFGNITRDISLHLAAQRVARVVEDPAGGDRKPLQARVPTARPESTSLLTDTFNEDELKSFEDPTSETLTAVHKRLVTAKVIGNEPRSLTAFHVAPEDFKVVLADSTAIYALGFGLFTNFVPMATFAAQDMRHVAVVGLFHRAINYSAFRRQTKAESGKSLQQAALESPYGIALVAGFRGSQCTVMATAPVPTAISARCMELFARGLQNGKTAAKSLEEVLNCVTANPEHRYARSVEGGTLPGGAPLSFNAAPVDPKAKAPASPTPPEDAELWLPYHSRTAYVLVGTPWIVAEPEAPAGKKK